MSLNSARDLFFNSLYDELESQDIYIVAADLAGLPFDKIRSEYPQRYVSVGIAEQNMIAVACGLALSGKKVITYTSNPFISLRAFDQIRNAIGIMNLPITIVGVGLGFSISEYGTTHFVTEDYQIMSMCPNMQIFTITDDIVSKKSVEYFLSGEGPCYLRFDKLCNGILPTVETIDFDKGFRILKRGKNVVILANGYMSHIACDVIFETQPTVIDMFEYPYNSEALIKEILKYDKVIVYEEQQSRGGIGSQILEMLNDKGISIEVKRLGIDYNGQFPKVYGSRNYWLLKYKLDDENLKKAVES